MHRLIVFEHQKTKVNYCGSSHIVRNVLHRDLKQLLDNLVACSTSVGHSKSEATSIPDCGVIVLDHSLNDCIRSVFLMKQDASNR